MGRRHWMRWAAGAALTLALAACNIHTMYGTGRAFEDEVVQENWPTAADIYAANETYFQERRASVAPQLALVAQGLNAELEPQLERAIARAKAVDWPAPKDNWNEIKGQLKTADNLLQAYDSYALLQDPALRSTKVQELSTTIYLLNGRLRETAATAFAAYDHFSGRSFFDAYPLNFQPARFMDAHYGRIKSEVEQANTLELGRFLDSYRMGQALQDDVGLHVRETYVDALTLERTGGRAPDLIEAWDVLNEVKGKGIDVKQIAQDRFAVLEVRSRPRVGEEGIAFPIRIKADTTFAVRKVGLEQALSGTAASTADYLIVADLATSKTASTEVGRTKVSSRHYSHSVFRTNPAYDQARFDLEQAQENLNAAISNRGGGQVRVNGSGNEAALAAILANLIGIAVDNSQITAAEEKVALAQEKLNEAPPQLEEEQFASYSFDRIVREGAKQFSVNYYMIDRKTGRYVKGRIDRTDRRRFAILSGARTSDPDLERHREDTYVAADLEDWLKEAAVVKASDIVEDVRKRRAAAEKLPPLALVQQDLLERRGAVALASRQPGRRAAPTAPGYGGVADYRFPRGDSRPDAFAVVVGERDYRNGDVPPVRFAYNDAEAIRQYLVETKGYPEEDVVVLKDPNQSDLMAYFGTETDPEGKLYDAVTREKLDEVFVYFSGHGVPTEDGAGVLLPSDADPLKPGLTGYKLETLVRNLNRLRDAHVTLAVDSCFSGLSHDGTLIRAASPVFLAARPEKTGLSNGVVFTAADGREIASWDERLRMGLFTRHLLEGMLGKADRTVGNGDGRVELFEMEAFLQTYVGREANRRYSRQQTPQVVGAPLTVVNDRIDPDIDGLEEILALAR